MLDVTAVPTVISDMVISAPQGALAFDILIIGGAIAIAFFFGLWLGKTFLAGLLFSFPLAAFGALLLEEIVDFTLLGTTAWDIALFKGGVFVLFTALFSVVMGKVAYAYSAHSAVARWMDLGILAFAAVGMLLALYHYPLSLNTLYTFNTNVQVFFSAQYTFWWYTTSLFVFFITVRR